MKSKKRQFIEACKSQPAAWLQACADNPSPYMRPMDIALIRLALRNGWHA